MKTTKIKPKALSPDLVKNKYILEATTQSPGIEFLKLFEIHVAFTTLVQVEFLFRYTNLRHWIITLNIYIYHCPYFVYEV